MEYLSSFTYSQKMLHSIYYSSIPPLLFLKNHQKECSVSCPKSIWLIMIHTARIVLALLIFGTLWCYMSENVGFEAIWLLVFHNSTVYVTNRDWEYQRLAAYCEGLTKTSVATRCWRVLPWLVAVHDFLKWIHLWRRGKKATNKNEIQVLILVHQ